MKWTAMLMGGGALVFLRHIGFALGFGAQVVWEGFLDGVTARKSFNKDTTAISDAIQHGNTANQS